MNIYLLLFRKPNGIPYPVEIAAPSQEEAIQFIESRDGSKFVTVITPR
jgi:hypothetical protein